MSVLIFLIVCFVLYFLPSILAMKNNHRNLAGVMLLNLFLGWSLLGWLGALIWAIYNE